MVASLSDPERSVHQLGEAFELDQRERAIRADGLR